MDYLNLGATGLRVSRICLGMMSYGPHRSRPWAIDESAAEPIVRAAVQGGITFFDTGQNGRGLSRKHIMASIDASLARLEVDYVDLYQIHRWDPHTPIEETMEALHDVVKAGKTRYIGASSMYAWQFGKAQAVARTRFSSMQNHYNLVYREEEREMIPQCIDQGVGVIPWSPMARGMLAGNRTREGGKLTARANTDAFGDSLYTPEADFPIVQRTLEVAGERGVSSVRWHSAGSSTSLV